MLSAREVITKQRTKQWTTNNRQLTQIDINFRPETHPNSHSGWANRASNHLINLTKILQNLRERTAESDPTQPPPNLKLDTMSRRSLSHGTQIHVSLAASTLLDKKLYRPTGQTPLQPPVTSQPSRFGQDSSTSNSRRRNHLATALMTYY